MRYLFALALLLSVAVLSLADSRKADARKLPPAVGRDVDFVKDIKPILSRSCVGCHGPEKQRGGLRLDSRDEALKGGNSGAVLRVGDGAGSRLLHVVAGLDSDTTMPPKGKTPLTREEIALLRTWIDQGLKWPRDKTTTGPTHRSNHWAFQTPVRPALPDSARDPWVRNGIDAFILARLRKEKMTPAPEADRATLIRRVSLDLIGLPPTPAEVDAFVNDPSPGAYENVVERLLASPHYGERWARHWLDVARYADSDGYEKDSARPFAWRWRHWVIEALNRDLPYDQFTIEQLAGDLLPNATTEQKVATGFHRNTLTNREGGVDQEQFRVEAVVDRVNTTAKVFLGLTLGCAQCHDHKYDPLSQREYYQFFAYFNSDREVNIPAPLPLSEAAWRKAQAAHEQKRATLVKARDDYRRDKLPAVAARWEKGLTDAERAQLPTQVAAILKIDPEKRTAAQKQVVLEHVGKQDARLIQLNRALTAHDRAAPPQPLAQTLSLGPTRKTQVLIRGDFLRPGVEVKPGTPSVLSPPQSGTTRLDLARWLVHADNPLTARVAVNWVWHKYFGRGLVATLEDFGTQGDKPSHPELLDWLACEFQARKWSLKDLHRLIVTSAAYRQSSKLRPEVYLKDPLNVFLARQSRLRLEAELLRDSALHASGLLARTLGGPSVRPPQPAGISELTYAGSSKWIESTGLDRYRRGLYIWFQRTSPYPMLTTFDSPDANVCAVRRERTNTPLQALTLLNDSVFVECAQALGRRVLLDLPEADAATRAEHAFRLCLGRKPSSVELARLTRLHAELLALARQSPDEAARLAGRYRPASVSAPEAATWVALARTLLNLDEFITRE